MDNPSTAGDPTFYHYKLIRKVVFRPESKYSYMTTALVGTAAITIVYGLVGTAFAVASLAIMLLVHAIVLRLTLRRVDEPSEKRWAFRRDWPWIGPLPVMDSGLSLFRRLHFHLFVVGCCVSALWYPWSDSSLIVSLLYWHIWLLTPRLRLLWKLRRERGDGVIRLSTNEVYYYHR